jgi:hypothetical protein
MINQHQHPTLYSAMLRSTQAHSHHHTPVQSGVRQAFAYQGYQGATGGSSGAQIPFNPHRSTHRQAVYAKPVNPLHSGGPGPFHPSYNVRLRSSVL